MIKQQGEVTVRLAGKVPERYKGDMLVYVVPQPAEGPPQCPDERVQAVVGLAFAAGDFSAKEEQTLLYYPGSEFSGYRSAQRVLVVGLGNQIPSREMFRRAGGVVATAARKTKAQRLLVMVPEKMPFAIVELVECLTEGLVLGAYHFAKYKTAEDDDIGHRLSEVAFAATSRVAVRKGLSRGVVASRAACLARTMANEPANCWRPSHFVDQARRLAETHGLQLTVLAKADFRRLGMGGILGVASGSVEAPKMIILEYRTGKKAPTLLVVGKGVTFDSGGLCLKPAKGMADMKFDMSGGAAVLALMQALGEERPKGCDVVAVVPAAENLPGSLAIKPGDVITLYGGKTVEVANTDAEGRLILADALAFGLERFTPAAVVDVATLTGAVIISLGHHRSGLFANDDALAEKMSKAGERSGELLWRLPLGPEYTKQLKSEVADLKNIGGRDGGSITAAAFLAEFVGNTPWAHLDIAGTAWSYSEKPYVTKGASGIGLRTLLELVRAW